jgi:hypothetical protein
MLSPAGRPAKAAQTAAFVNWILAEAESGRSVAAVQQL